MPDLREGDVTKRRDGLTSSALVRIIAGADPGPGYPAEVRRTAILDHMSVMSPADVPELFSLVHTNAMLTILDGLHELFPPDRGNAENAAARLVPLIKEYTTKRKELNASIRKLQSAGTSAKSKTTAFDSIDPKNLLEIRVARASNDFHALRFAVSRLRPATEDLIRHASQLVEHGNLDVVTRMELALRLAEFESEVRIAEQRLSRGPTG